VVEGTAGNTGEVSLVILALLIRAVAKGRCWGCDTPAENKSSGK
jgi:hypothetical protein